MISFRYVLVFLNFLCFCFMINKYYLMLLNSRRYLTLETLFFTDEKQTQWNLDTKVKVFHESISYFMKCSWNCISWNAFKEKFRSVSLPLRKKLWTAGTDVLNMADASTIYGLIFYIMIMIYIDFRVQINIKTPELNLCRCV